MNFNKIYSHNTALNNTWFYIVLQMIDDPNSDEHCTIESLTKCLSSLYISGDFNKTDVEKIVNKTDFYILLKRTDLHYIKLQFFPGKSYVDVYISDGSEGTSHYAQRLYHIYKILTYTFKIHNIYINYKQIEFSHNDIIDDTFCEMFKKIKKEDSFSIVCKYAFTVLSIRKLYKLLKIPNITFYFWKEFDEKIIRIFDIHAHKDIKKYKHIKEIPVTDALILLEYTK